MMKYLYHIFLFLTLPDRPHPTSPATPPGGYQNTIYRALRLPLRAALRHSRGCEAQMLNYLPPGAANGKLFTFYPLAGIYNAFCQQEKELKPAMGKTGNHLSPTILNYGKKPAEDEK